MEIRENNLYVTGRIIQLDDGDQFLLRDKLVTVGTLTDQYHTVNSLDRLDILAWKYYSVLVADSSKYWWVIADANNIYNPFDLTEYFGKELLIPNILNVKTIL